MSVDTLVNDAEKDINTRLEKLKVDIKAIPPVVVPPTPTTNIYDDFKYTESFVQGQQSKNGKWLLEYTSSGFAKADNNGLLMSPGGSALSIYGGSALLRSTKKWANSRVTFWVTNEKQVYEKKAGWMAPWPFIRHANNHQHWYIILGLDGVEIGRKDAPLNITDQAEIEKYQFTIWTGGPATPIGTKRKVTQEFIGNTLKTWIDDKLIATLVDDGNLLGTSTAFNKIKLKPAGWTSGEFCPYVEGCQVRFQDITIETL